MEIKPNIYSKLLGIMEDLQYIKKRPKAGLPYPYISHDDVSEALHPLFIKHGIMSLPSVVSRSWEGNRCSILVRVTFVNVDNPEDCATVQCVGDGQGATDKEAGKALSYAVKMCYLKVFCLATGEKDNEQEEIKHQPLAPGIVRKALSYIEKVDDVGFSRLCNELTDAQKMALWAEFNVKAREEARQLLKLAREAK